MNQGIHVLTTPLVNPKNYNDPSKINYFIRKNFQNETLELSNEMKEYMSYESLEHMIDFESAVFNKKISVLSKEGSHNPPSGIDNSKYMMLSSRNIIDGKINYDQARYLSKSDFEKEDKRTQVREKDVLLTIVGAIGRTAVAPKDMKHITFQRSVAVLKPNNNKVDSFYLKYYLEAINEVILMEAHGLAQKGIYLNQIKKLKIVLPEKDTVQVDIIKKCKAIEKEYSNTKMNYERYLEEIKNIFVKEKIMSLQKR